MKTNAKFFVVMIVVLAAGALPGLVDAQSDSDHPALFDNNTNYLELRDSGPGGTERVIGAPDVAGGVDTGLLGGAIGALATLVGGSALGSENLGFDASVPPGSNRNFPIPTGIVDAPLSNTSIMSKDQLMSIMADGMKAPGERPIGSKTDLFDNNKNYMELRKDPDNGPGGTGVVPGNVLNAMISFGVFSKESDQKEFVNNLTATTKPVDKGPMMYLLELTSAVNAMRKENAGTASKVESTFKATGPLKFSEPTEMKGGLMERSETMVTSRIGNTLIDVNVPGGHEDIANTFAKDLDSMPIGLKSILAQGKVWFASSGIGIQGIYTVNREGSSTTASRSITVDGSNGKPRAITRGELAYTLADMLEQMYGGYGFSRPHSTMADYDGAIKNDFAANPATPKYVTPAAADWASTHFGDESQNSEDFKESVQMWVTDHDNFAKTYPSRSEMLDVILNKEHYFF